MADGDCRSASRAVAPILLALLAVFVLRVIGQVLVATGWNLGFLPPMEEWQSGLLPYPLLVVFQITIIGFYTWIIRDFFRGNGFWTESHRGRGKGILVFGAVYFASMIVRYVMRMWVHPDARWFGGTIPIFLHCVLATFLMIVGRFQWKCSSQKIR